MFGDFTIDEAPSPIRPLCATLVMGYSAYAAYTSFTAYTQDDETENVTKIKSCFPGWKMTRCFDGWWHDVIWETGTLSNRQLALEFFLFRFLLTLVKRNLDDRQFTSWIKEVNRLADS